MGTAKPEDLGVAKAEVLGGSHDVCPAGHPFRPKGQRPASVSHVRSAVVSGIGVSQLLILAISCQ